MGGTNSDLKNKLSDDNMTKAYSQLLLNFKLEKQYFDKNYSKECNLFKFKKQDSNYFIVEFKETALDEQDMAENLKQNENKIKNSHPNILALHMAKAEVEESSCSCSDTKYKIFKLMDKIEQTLQDNLNERQKCNPMQYFSEEQIWNVLEQISSALTNMEGLHYHLRAETIYIVNSINNLPLYKITYKGVIKNTSNYEDCIKGMTQGRYLSSESLKCLEEKRDTTSCFEESKFALGMILLSLCILQSLDSDYDYIQCSLNTNMIIDKLQRITQQYSSDLVQIISKLIISDQTFDWNTFNNQLSQVPQLRGKRIQDTYQDCPLYLIPIILESANKDINNNNNNNTFLQLPLDQGNNLVNGKTAIFGMSGETSANGFSGQSDGFLGQKKETTIFGRALNFQGNTNNNQQNNIFEQGNKNNLIFGATNTQPSLQGQEQQNLQSSMLFVNNDNINNSFTQNNLNGNKQGTGGIFQGQNLNLNGRGLNLSGSGQSFFPGGTGQPLNINATGQFFNHHGIDQGININGTGQQGFNPSGSGVNLFPGLINQDNYAGVAGLGQSMLNQGNILDGLNIQNLSELLNLGNLNLGGEVGQFGQNLNGNQMNLLGQQIPNFNLNQLLNNNNSNNLNLLINNLSNQNQSGNSQNLQSSNRKKIDRNQVNQHLLEILNMNQQSKRKQNSDNDINNNTLHLPSNPFSGQGSTNNTFLPSPQKANNFFNSFNQSINQNEPFNNNNNHNNSNSFHNGLDKEERAQFNELRCIPHKSETVHYPDGSLYEGQMILDFRDGYGKLTFSNQGSYEGIWKMDKMHGQGTLLFPSGEPAYVGEWYMDQFHNLGYLHNAKAEKLNEKFDFKDFDNLQNYWQTYEGDFCLDLKHGFGTLILTNGEKLVGHFRDDLVHGDGIYYSMDGQHFNGYWENNILLRRQKV